MHGRRWLADEMLGRLARYLRFLGGDVRYARDVSDDEILRLAQDDGRTLLTRDRQLAARTPGSLLIRSHEISEQLLEIRRAFPDLSLSVTFVRCSECNGLLGRWQRPPDGKWPEALPESFRSSEEPVFVCEGCGQFYWEGSHTRRIRSDIARWTGSAPQ
ncbi:MAG: Mut7-C RNAse domain-containing protein [Candidatus Lutacidiplasmatales archaeon]